MPEAKRLLGDRFLPRKMGTIDYLGFPLFDKRFANADLRRAFSMAIDREGINKAVYNGDYIPADSLLPPIISGYRQGACGGCAPTTRPRPRSCTKSRAASRGRWSCTSPMRSRRTRSG